MKRFTASKSVNQQIFRALVSLTSMALLIRVAGMFNQVVITAQFGLEATMDAYFVASSLPLLLSQLIGSAIEYSVIPAYARVSTEHGKEQASILFSTLLNLLLIGTLVLTIIMLAFRFQLIHLSAPALDTFRTDLAATLSLFVLPGLLLMVVIHYLDCILTTEGQFGWPAYTGILVPLSTALFVLAVGKSLGILTLCIGMLIGLCLHLLAFVLRIRRARLRYWPILNLRSPGLSTVMLLAGPALLVALISQAGPIVDQIFASALSPGSISAINYSLKIVSIPIGVIFASVGRAILPHLSRQVAEADMQAFKATLRFYLWLTCSSTAVLSISMIILAQPLVRLLFQHGAFTAEDTRLTAITFMGFVIGLVPMSVGFIISRAFSALGKTRILIGVTFFSVFANAFLDYILARYWQSFGIALATSIVYIFTMLILFFSLRRTIGRLAFFTPPAEIIQLLKKTGMLRLSKGLYRRTKRQLTEFRSSLRVSTTRIGMIILVFASGITGMIVSTFATLRFATGSLALLLFLRYHYLLLLCWALINVFIGSTLAFFNGNNLLSVLTVPTLLLLFFLPTGNTFKRIPALALLLLYNLWVLAGIGFSPLGVGTFLTTWITHLDYIAVGVLTVNLITTRRRLMRFIDAILLPSTFVALYGIYGYFTRQHGLIDQETSLFRISSIFDISPTLALFLSIVIPLALYRSLTLRNWQRISVLLVVCILVVALVLTFTRGAYISILIGALVMICFLPSYALKLAVSGALAMLALASLLVIHIGNFAILSRFSNQDLGTFNGRTYLWQAIIDHLDPAQLLGNGLQASDALIVNLHVGFRGVIGDTVHNLYLSVLYDHGIIGLTLFVLVFLTLIVNLIKGMRHVPDEQRMLFITALVICVIVLVQSFTSNDFWIQGVGVYFWMMTVLPFAQCWSHPVQKIAMTASLQNETERGMGREITTRENRAAYSW